MDKREVRVTNPFARDVWDFIGAFPGCFYRDIAGNLEATPAKVRSAINRLRHAGAIRTETWLLHNGTINPGKGKKRSRAYANDVHLVLVTKGTEERQHQIPTEASEMAKRQTQATIEFDKKVLRFIHKNPACTTREVMEHAATRGVKITQGAVLDSMYRLRDHHLVVVHMQSVEDERIDSGFRNVARAFPANGAAFVSGSTFERAIPEETQEDAPPAEEAISPPPAPDVRPPLPEIEILLAPPLDIPKDDSIEAARIWLAKLLGSATEIKTHNCVTMTPNRWRAALELNTNNRKIMQGRVNKYRVVIEADKWIDTTDAVGFDTRPRMINGQHRGRASIDANKAIICDIKINMRVGSDLVLDGGLSRKNKDNLKTQLGIEKFGGLISATANWIEMYKRGLPDHFSGTEARLDRVQIVSYVHDHPDVVEAAEMGALIGREMHGAIVKNIAAAAYYITREIDAAQAEEFFHKLRTGAGLEDDNPILVLRRKMQRYGGRLPKTGVSGNNMCPQLAQVIYAWNYFRAGKFHKQLPNWKKGLRFPAFK